MHAVNDFVSSRSVKLNLNITPSFERTEKEENEITPHDGAIVLSSQTLTNYNEVVLPEELD